MLANSRCIRSRGCGVKSSAAGTSSVKSPLGCSSNSNLYDPSMSTKMGAPGLAFETGESTNLNVLTQALPSFSNTNPRLLQYQENRRSPIVRGPQGQVFVLGVAIAPTGRPMNREYHKWYSSRLGRDM